MVKLFCAVVGVGSVFPVDIELSETVGDLKKKIKEENPGLIHFDADLLKLYLARIGATWLNSRDADMKALKRGEIPDRIKSLMQEHLLLDEAWDLNDEAYFGKSFERVKGDIHVLVKLPEKPDEAAGDRSSPSASIHSENRRKRWRELNDILDKNKKAKTNGDDSTSTGYSYVRWGQVKSVLGFERYKQERKPIPDDTFKFLVDYLKYASDAMDGYTDASREAKLYHFIAPVLIMLCSLFDDVKLEVEETVDGNEVHADGHFEFVLTRGKKKIYIAQAKKNDFDKGRAQALVGCEAVADREGLYVVYGIVTDFMKWHLYRSGENSILMDSSTLGAKSDELEVDSLRDVCEMIYGALLDHEEECKKENLSMAA
ncbi:hypothetical protein PINS_up001570 [Pythium insidiosum]|nr:hypothetical protein PINS_up001570 [Pythium insidiosum]